MVSVGDRRRAHGWLRRHARARFWGADATLVRPPLIHLLIGSACAVGGWLAAARFS